MRVRMLEMLVGAILSGFFISLSFAQSIHPTNVDSVEYQIQNSSGQERAELVADFTRNANFHTINHKPFKPYLEEAFLWESKHPNPQLLNVLRLGMVNMMIAEKNQVEAVRQLQEILHSGESMSRKDSVSTYTFLLGIYKAAGAYTEAWEILLIRDGVLSRNLEKSPFFEQFRKQRIADLANVYLLTEQYEKATHQFRKLIRFSGEESNFHYQAGAYNNLGITFLKINQPDSAIYQFKKSIQCWNLKLGKKDTISFPDLAFVDLVEGNIGSAYNQKGRYKEAFPLLRKDLKTRQKQKIHGGEVSGLHELSITYMGVNQPEKALELLDSATMILNTFPDANGERKNLEQRIVVLESLGKIDQAYDLHKKWVTFKDSMADVENQSRVNIMEVVYEVEQKNLEIAHQKLDLAKAEAKAERQRRWQLSLFGGVFLMMIILLFLVYQAAQRKKRVTQLADKNQEIEYQKKLIQQSLTEKEILLKEVYHRVKNNLQLISGILELQAIKIEDQKVKEMMEESQNRVHTIALIHQQLYQSNDLSKIDFHDYLVKLVNDIAILFNNPKCTVEYDIKVNGLSFDLNLAVSLGLIINELVTNAFTHGFVNQKAGTIFIGIEPKEKELYELTVGDDGIGLPKGFDPTKLNSLGLRLVKGLSRQLGGNYRMENGQGSRFIVQFKYNENG